MLALMLVSSLASAQSPIKVTSDNGIFTFTNVSNKTIVLVAGHADKAQLAHEFLFKKQGFPTGATFDLDTRDDGVPSSVQIAFVQFEDGSTWGDRNDPAAQDASQKRNESLSLLPSLANAPDEQTFLSILNQPQPDGSIAASRFQSIQREQGANKAFTNAKDRWAIALSRRSIWSF